MSRPAPYHPAFSIDRLAGAELGDAPILAASLEQATGAIPLVQAYGLSGEPIDRLRMPLVESSEMQRWTLPGSVKESDIIAHAIALRPALAEAREVRLIQEALVLPRNSTGVERTVILFPEEIIGEELLRDRATLVQALSELALRGPSKEEVLGMLRDKTVGLPLARLAKRAPRSDADVVRRAVYKSGPFEIDFLPISPTLKTT